MSDCSCSQSVRAQLPAFKLRSDHHLCVSTLNYWISFMYLPRTVSACWLIFVGLDTFTSLARTRTQRFVFPWTLVYWKYRWGRHWWDGSVGKPSSRRSLWRLEHFPHKSAHFTPDLRGSVKRKTRPLLSWVNAF